MHIHYIYYFKIDKSILWKKKTKYLIQRPKSIKKKIGRLLGDNKALSINCIQNNVSLYSEDSISQYSEDSIGQYYKTLTEPHLK